MAYRLRAIVMALAALVGAGALTAGAAERRAFDATAFAAAQTAGKSIIVHVSAPWCPTCKAQKPILDTVSAEPEFKDAVVFDLDFDTGGAALRELNVRSQSTLIAFKGDKETGRSVGDTNADSVAALLKTAL